MPCLSLGLRRAVTRTLTSTSGAGAFLGPSPRLVAAGLGVLHGIARCSSGAGAGATVPFGVLGPRRLSAWSAFISAALRDGCAQVRGLGTAMRTTGQGEASDAGPFRLVISIRSRALTPLAAHGSSLGIRTEARISRAFRGGASEPVVSRRRVSVLAAACRKNERAIDSKVDAVAKASVALSRTGLLGVA